MIMTTTASITSSSIDDESKSQQNIANSNSTPIINSTREPSQPIISATSKKPASSKYRHVAAVHSKARTSCLSHDSDVSPSFLGFRNLMVLVLGEWSSPTDWLTKKTCETNTVGLTVVMNLRLVVENYMKVNSPPPSPLPSLILMILMDCSMEFLSAYVVTTTDVKM